MFCSNVFFHLDESVLPHAAYNHFIIYKGTLPSKRPSRAPMMPLITLCSSLLDLHTALYSCVRIIVALSAVDVIAAVKRQYTKLYMSQEY